MTAVPRMTMSSPSEADAHGELAVELSHRALAERLDRGSGEGSLQQSSWSRKKPPRLRLSAPTIGASAMPSRSPA